MAKGIRTLGGVDSRGSVGGVTTRGYRGLTIIHNKKRMPRRVLATLTLSKESDITGMIAKWNFEESVVLRTSGPNFYIVSAPDLIGGIGNVSQAVNANQPRYVPPNQSSNGHGYGEADGTNDLLSSGLVVPVISQPFEIWMVADEGVVPTAAKFMYGISDTQARGLSKRIPAPYELQMRGGVNYVGGVRGVNTPKVWRCVWNGASSSLWRNGIRGAAEGNVGAGEIRQLTMWARLPATGWSNYKLWRMCIFNRILTPTEAALLTNYYRAVYGIA